MNRIENLIFSLFLVLIFITNCKKEEPKTADPLEEAGKLLAKYDFSDNFFSALDKLQTLIASDLPPDKTRKVYELYYQGKLDAFIVGSMKEDKNILEKAMKSSDISTETRTKFLTEKVMELDSLFAEKNEGYLKELTESYRFVQIMQKQAMNYEEIQLVSKVVKDIFEQKPMMQTSMLISTVGFLQKELGQILNDWEDTRLQKLALLTSVFMSSTENPPPFPDRKADIDRFMKFLGKFNNVMEKIPSQDPMKVHFADSLNNLKAGLNGKIITLSPEKEIPVTMPKPEEGQPPPPKWEISSKMGEPAVLGAYNPLEVLIVSRDGVFAQVRPVLAFSEGVLKKLNQEIISEEKGKLLSGREQLDKLTKIEPVKEIIDGIKDLTEKVKDLTARSFVQGVGKGIFNTDKEQNKRAVLLAVDKEVKPEYLELTMASLKESGYNDLRLVRGLDTASAFPVLYRTDEYLKDREEFKTHTRYMVVFIYENTVEVFPPAGAKQKPNPPKQLPPYPFDIKMIEGTEEKPMNVVFSYKQEQGLGGKLFQLLGRIEFEYGYSPIVHIGVKKGAKTETVLEAAGVISSGSGNQIEQLTDIYPMLRCSAMRPNCVTHIPIVFSNIAFGKAPEKPLQVIEDRPIGFCDRQAVAKVVTGRSGAIKACYEAQLLRHPELQGKLTVRWTINEDGTVSDLSIVSTELNNKSVDDCVMKQISTLKFNKPEGGICIINWPFKFVRGE